LEVRERERKAIISPDTAQVFEVTAGRDMEKKEYVVGAGISPPTKREEMAEKREVVVTLGRCKCGYYGFIDDEGLCRRCGDKKYRRNPANIN